MSASAQTPLTIEQRKAILMGAIGSALRNRYRVLSQTDTAAQLVRPKRFSCLWSALWFLFFGVGLIWYVLYYLSKQDETMFIEVDEWGEVLYGGARPALRRASTITKSSPATTSNDEGEMDTGTKVVIVILSIAAVLVACGVLYLLSLLVTQTV
jgi:hypothetical protein